MPDDASENPSNWDINYDPNVEIGQGIWDMFDDFLETSPAVQEDLQSFPAEQAASIANQEQDVTQSSDVQSTIALHRPDTVAPEDLCIDPSILTIGGSSNTPVPSIESPAPVANMGQNVQQHDQSQRLVVDPQASIITEGSLATHIIQDDDTTHRDNAQSIDQGQIRMQPDFGPIHNAFLEQEQQSQMRDRSCQPGQDSVDVNESPQVLNPVQQSSAAMNIWNSTISFHNAAAQNNAAHHRRVHRQQFHGFNEYAPSQLPGRNLYRAYQQQTFQMPYYGDQTLSPQTQQQSSVTPAYGELHPTPTIHPQATVTPDVRSPSYSLTPAFEDTLMLSPEPEYTPRQNASKKRKRSKSPPTRKESRQCIDCHKMFKKSALEDRCQRCALKHLRHNATPRTYNLSSAVPDLDVAKKVVYSPVQGRGQLIRQLDRVRRDENVYVQRFLDAVNEVVSGGEGGDHDDPSLTWHARQQVVLNQKARLEEGYSEDQMTARLRALFFETVSFHTGSDMAFYSTGGDNAGYGDNPRLSFEERINEICQLLRSNKRIVMDVVEGRGVQAFIGNPKGYDKRKCSNNECNEIKKEIMKKGKESGEFDADVEGQGKPRRGRRKKTLPRVDETPEGEAGPSTTVRDDLMADPDADWTPDDQGEPSYGSGRSWGWVRSTRGRPRG